MRKLVALLIIFAGMVFCLDYSDQIQVKQKELEGIYKEITKQKGNQDEIEKKVQQLNIELSNIDKVLAQQDRMKSKIESQIRSLEKEVDWLREQVRIDKRTFEEVLVLLEKKYYNYYKLGNYDWMDVLFSNEDFKDRMNLLYAYESLIKDDVGFLAELKEKSTKLKYQEFRLEAQLQILNEKKETIRALEQKILDNKGKKQVLLDEMMVEKEKYEKREKELLKESSEIENMIKILERQSKVSLVVGDGKYIWPALGKVTSGFGYRIHPILRVSAFHTGIDIGAPNGRPIFAVDDGEVIYSGKLENYGNMIMIDHGNNTTTVYAHLSKIMVKNKLIVKKGNVIGLVGSSGLSTGPHLHFEIRKFGKVEDPLKYLPKR